jgi:hypothetical protein
MRGESEVDTNDDLLLNLRRSAIAHGAVCKGFLDGVDNGTQEYYLVNKPIKITATIARVSVRICIQEPWDEKRHQEVDKYWCDYEGVWNADNQMMWLLKKVSAFISPLLSSNARMPFNKSCPGKAG